MSWEGVGILYVSRRATGLKAEVRSKEATEPPPNPDLHDVDENERAAREADFLVER